MCGRERLQPSWMDKLYAGPIHELVPSLLFLFLAKKLKRLQIMAEQI
jgi:hypothetical protein